MGYYYVTPNNSEQQPDPAQRGQLFGVFLAPFLTGPQAKAIFQPFEIAVNASKWVDPVIGGSLTIESPDFSAEWASHAEDENVGFVGRLGSRLIDGKALSTDFDTLKAKLRGSTPQPWALLGHAVAGPGTRNALIPGGSNSVLPAWRKAYTHIGEPFHSVSSPNSHPASRPLT